MKSAKRPGRTWLRGPRTLAGIAALSTIAALAMIQPWTWGGGDPEPRLLVALPERESAATTAGTPVSGGDASSSDPEDARGRCEREVAPGTYADTAVFGDEERGFRVTIPPSDGYRQPLVLNFHGESRSAEEQDASSGLDALASREGFVLLSPEGSGSPRGWTIPGVYRDDIADDATFVLALLESAMDRLCVDPGRVYATGISNGGEMAAWLACVAPQQFAAIASVAGLVFPGCEAGRVAVLGIHGTDDGNVPYELGAESASEWAAYHGCTGIAEEQLSEHAHVLTYTECDGGEVEFITVDGGGHTWPGATVADGADAITPEVNASDLIWQFFVTHPRE